MMQRIPLKMMQRIPLKMMQRIPLKITQALPLTDKRQLKAEVIAESNSIQKIAFDLDTCSGCGACIRTCPQRAIHGSTIGIFIDEDLCNSCGECVEICPKGSLVFSPPPGQT
ncbi:4Fe-4S binding protein [Acidithrix ferrooxidans]|uniref:Ferredoxin n=1 Tax=Acidithrix ferrooxidans TaxID=1280514 RepID=A0A0D8HJI2_9ACTN|nr:4Fe-4S binding protein [Acidithrix ferrooxidans]KJF18110.1 ferredoxin [Acidithrix ferrooxidans]